MVVPYFKLLKQRNFFLLCLAQIVSQFGDKLTQIALVGLVASVFKTSSSLVLALVFVLSVAPVLIFSPVSGVYIDRWSKRKTMYICDSLRGLFIILIPLFFLKPRFFPLICILIFLSSSVGRFSLPAKMAFVPQIIDKKEIFLANSLISVTATTAAIFGVGLGGIIFDNFGAQIAFRMDSVTFFISALAIFFITVVEKKKFLVEDILHLGKDAVDKVKESFVWELKEGVKYIFNSDGTKYAFRTFIFLFSYVGALSTVFIKYIQNVLGTLTKDVGLTTVSLALGILLGSLVYGRVAHKLLVRKVINLSTLTASIFLIFFTISLKVYPYSFYAIFLTFILGLMISPIFVGVNGLIHKESKDALLGRIFSGLEFISHLGFLISMFIFAFLAYVFSSFTIMILIGIIGFLCSLIFIFRDDKNRRK